MEGEGRGDRLMEGGRDDKRRGGVSSVHGDGSAKGMSKREEIIGEKGRASSLVVT